MPHRFRFSIGQVMGLIALSALLMANAISISRGNTIFYTVLTAAILVAGLGVLLYNRRLSRWMWVWIVGQAGPLVVMPVQVLLSTLFSNDYFYSFIAIQMSVYLVCHLLTVVGFAMTFREIRRKLAIYENAPTSEAQRLTAPPP